MHALDPASDEYKMIQTYVKNTHGSTHNNYSLEILDAFALEKDQPYNPAAGNRQLLWHGAIEILEHRAERPQGRASPTGWASSRKVIDRLIRVV